MKESNGPASVPASVAAGVIGVFLAGFALGFGTGMIFTCVFPPGGIVKTAPGRAVEHIESSFSEKQQREIIRIVEQDGYDKKRRSRREAEESFARVYAEWERKRPEDRSPLPPELPAELKK